MERRRWQCQHEKAALECLWTEAPEGRITTSYPGYLVLSSSAHALGAGADA
jgi:hypothetical protein